MTKKDSATCEELIKSLRDDYPAQIFVAFDGASRPCVILHFDDANGHRDFMTHYFSTMTAAFEAFLKVEEKLRALDDFYAEKTDCRVDGDKNVTDEFTKLLESNKELWIDEFLPKK